MSKRVIVFGAGGAVGEAAAHALIARGWSVVASMRTKSEEAETRLRENGAEVRFDDLTHVNDDLISAAANCDAFVFATHLSLTLAALARIEPRGRRIVAFSDNNVAALPHVGAYVELGHMEQRLRASGASVSLIRPTLIYGDPRLPTLSKLMRSAKKSKTLFLSGAENALIQPVFYEDVGRAAAWAADAQEQGVYALGGPDAVTMRALYRYITRAAGNEGSIVTIHPALLRIASPLLSTLGVISPDQNLRAVRDRLPVKQTPPPAEIVPRVGLKEGLARLALALG